MVVLKKELKGFTLVETLMAMVIIMLSFGLGVSIYYNLLNTSNSHQLLNAQLYENNILNKTILKNDFLDTTYDFPNMTINRKVSPFKTGNNLSVIELDVLDTHGKLITNQKEVIVNP